MNLLINLRNTLQGSHPGDLMLFYRFCVSIRGLGTRLLCSSNMADLKGSALVILAEGAEEMEAVITTDVLRRGKVSWRM